MVLQIDSSAPLLRPSQLTALVRAVQGADPHDEHRWIEWKSTLDLTTPAGQTHLVKHILGLANRQPAAAAQRAGGYGYLLVGVEPGTINGVPTVDPEILIGKIRVYVGDSVRWTPEYIELGGQHVLVVIVDPPRPGDPIHSLRKQLDRFPAGTIFVRHTGRTDPATPGDLDMLQARLLERTPSLQIGVAAVPPTIEETPNIVAVVNQWAHRQRPVLLAARHQPSPRPTVPEDYLHPLRGLMGPLAPTIQPDTRTEEQYAEQVEKYLKKAREVLVDRALWDLYRHAPALLRLQVNNPTDVGYTGVRLAVHVSGQVKGYPEELVRAVGGDRPNLPRPPGPLGTPTETKGFLGSTNMYAGNVLPPIPDLSRYVGPGPGYTVRDTGSVTIDYEEFEVRPKETVTLDSVPLLVQEDAGMTLPATWAATAAQVRGRLTGEFVLTVNASSLDLASLE